MNTLSFKAGEIPGEGKYRCRMCGHIVYLDEGEELPFCPKCNDIVWIKVVQTSSF